MNIGFEAKRFFTNYTGLGNYSRFVIDALSQFYPENSYYLYSPRTGDHEENRAILKRKNVNVIAPTGLYGKPGFSALWRTFGLSKDRHVNSLNVFHGLSQELPLGLPSSVKKVVTVHDLIFLRYPKFYSLVDAAIYKRKVKAACEKADRIIAISQQTAEDVRQFLKISDESKIEVVYQGCHPVFKKVISEDQLALVKRKYALPDQFILNVGTVEERKNLKLLVKAIASLPISQRLPLVVVGRHTPYFETVMQEVKASKMENSVLFLNGVAFHDLPAIYKQSRLFVYPSFFEGFGIPLIESLTCGIPLITSRGSCFKEASGPGGVYIDPTSHEQLAAEISSLLHNEDRRRELLQAGQDHIRRFEPQVIAKDLNSIYNQLSSHPFIV